jgi:hypothetical protein
MSSDTASQSSCNQPVGLLGLRSIRAIALSPMSATIVVTNTAPTAHTAFCRPGRSLNTAHSVGSASDVTGYGLDVAGGRILSVGEDNGATRWPYRKKLQP